MLPGMYQARFMLSLSIRMLEYFDRHVVCDAKTETVSVNAPAPADLRKDVRQLLALIHLFESRFPETQEPFTTVLLTEPTLCRECVTKAERNLGRALHALQLPSLLLVRSLLQLALEIEGFPSGRESAGSEQMPSSAFRRRSA
jgi:hypothetical protein